MQILMPAVAAMTPGRLGDIHFKRVALELFSRQGLDGFLGVGENGHFNETKTLALPMLRDQTDIDHLAEAAELLLKLLPRDIG